MIGPSSSQGQSHTRFPQNQPQYNPNLNNKSRSETPESRSHFQPDSNDSVSDDGANSKSSSNASSYMPGSQEDDCNDDNVSTSGGVVCIMPPAGATSSIKKSDHTHIMPGSNVTIISNTAIDTTKFLIEKLSYLGGLGCLNLFPDGVFFVIFDENMTVGSVEAMRRIVLKLEPSSYVVEENLFNSYYNDLIQSKSVLVIFFIEPGAQINDDSHFSQMQNNAFGGATSSLAMLVKQEYTGGEEDNINEEARFINFEAFSASSNKLMQYQRLKDKAREKIKTKGYTDYIEAWKLVCAVEVLQAVGKANYDLQVLKQDIDGIIKSYQLEISKIINQPKQQAALWTAIANIRLAQYHLFKGDEKTSTLYFGEATNIYGTIADMVNRLEADELDQDVAAIYIQLAFFFCSCENYEQAKKFYDAALKIYESAEVLDQHELIPLLGFMAETFTLSKKYDDAIVLYTEMLKLKKQIHTRNIFHPDILLIIDSIADVYTEKVRDITPEDGIVPYLIGVEIYQKIMALYIDNGLDKHDAVLTSLENIAEIFASQGEVAEQSALDANSKSDNTTALTKYSDAAVYYEAAVDNYNNAIAFVKRNNSDDADKTATLNEIGNKIAQVNENHTRVNDIIATKYSASNAVRLPIIPEETPRGEAWTPRREEVRGPWHSQSDMVSGSAEGLTVPLLSTQERTNPEKIEDPREEAPGPFQSDMVSGSTEGLTYPLLSTQEVGYPEDNNPKQEDSKCCPPISSSPCEIL